MLEAPSLDHVGLLLVQAWLDVELVLDVKLAVLPDLGFGITVHPARRRATDPPAVYVVEPAVAGAEVEFLLGKPPHGTPEVRAGVAEYIEFAHDLRNSCAHLGCPVRWFPEKKLYLCPCHGGLYDINGGWVGGPPPRGMYRYTEAEVRENGKLYIKHKFNIEPGLDKQQPYVV